MKLMTEKQNGDPVEQKMLSLTGKSIAFKIQDYISLFAYYEYAESIFNIMLKVKYGEAVRLSVKVEEI